MTAEIKFIFAIEQPVKVLCLSIVTKGTVIQRTFTESKSASLIRYLVKIDGTDDTVLPSESLLVDTQIFPLGHQMKGK